MVVLSRASCMTWAASRQSSQLECFEPFFALASYSDRSLFISATSKVGDDVSSRDSGRLRSRSLSAVVDLIFFNEGFDLTVFRYGSFFAASLMSGLERIFRISRAMRSRVDPPGLGPLRSGAAGNGFSRPLVELPPLLLLVDGR